MCRILPVKKAVVLAIVLILAVPNVAYADLVQVKENPDFSGLIDVDPSSSSDDETPQSYVNFTTDGGASGGIENYHTNDIEVALGVEPAGGGASESQGEGSVAKLTEEGRIEREAVIEGTSTSSDSSEQSGEDREGGSSTPGNVYVNDDPVHSTQKHEFDGGYWISDSYDKPVDDDSSIDIGGTLQKGTVSDEGGTIIRTVGINGVMVEENGSKFVYFNPTGDPGSTDTDSVERTIVDGEGFRDALRKLDNKDEGESGIVVEPGSTDKGKYTSYQIGESFEYNGKTYSIYSMTGNAGETYNVHKTVSSGDSQEMDPIRYEWRVKALDDTSEYNGEWHMVDGSFPANESRRLLYRTGAWGRIKGQSRLVYNLEIYDDWEEHIVAYDDVTGEKIADYYESHHDLVETRTNLRTEWEDEGTVINPLIPNNEPHPYLCYGDGCSYDCAHTPGIVCSEDDVTVKVDDRTELVK